MNLNDISSITQLLYHIVATASFIIAAIWFIRTTKYKQRIEFTIDGSFLELDDGYSICEINLCIENKGLINHKLYDLAISVKGTRTDLSGLASSMQNKSIVFTEDIIETREIVKNYGYYFVRPGVKQSLSYNILIPPGFRAISVLSAFSYKPRYKYNIFLRVIGRIIGKKSLYKQQFSPRGALDGKRQKHQFPHTASKILEIK